MNFKKIKIILLSFFLVLLLNSSSFALELLMYSNPHCSFCQRFLNEVEPGYNRTSFSRELPLSILSTDREFPRWFDDAVDNGRIRPLRFTPTFIFWDGEREVARLEGFVSKEWFYQRLGQFLEKYKSFTNKKPPVFRNNHEENGDFGF